MKQIFLLTERLTSRIAATVAVENPRDLHHWPLDSPKITGVISSSCITGLYFIDDELNGNIMTVNAEQA